jgi:orotidine-5'-phosphate decarboxylase
MSADTKLFLDLKLHDIPAQVAGAIEVVSDLGVTLTTVHASGGREMLSAAVRAAGDGLTVLAVTVLTSLGDPDLEDLGVRSKATEQVLRLADLALSSGIPGLVCSPLEVGAIRERFGTGDRGGPFLVVPGIRPRDARADDQKRTLAPAEAVDLGADLIVVGRPITGASEPAEATRAIVSELAA